MHVDAIRRLQGKAKNGNGKHPPVFKAEVPEGNAIASSAEFVKPGTLRQKYAYQGGYETVQDLATEITTAAGI